MGAEGGERNKLERLCRYIARPAVSTERLALAVQGNVRYRFKTAYRDGTSSSRTTRRGLRANPGAGSSPRN